VTGIAITRTSRQPATLVEVGVSTQTGLPQNLQGLKCPAVLPRNEALYIDQTSSCRNATLEQLGQLNSYISIGTLRNLRPFQSGLNHFVQLSQLFFCVTMQHSHVLENSRATQSQKLIRVFV